MAVARRVMFFSLLGLVVLLANAVPQRSGFNEFGQLRPRKNAADNSRMLIPAKCDEFWEGESCEWPICGRHGRVDVSTRLCICQSNFSPPFCRSCIDGFWGSKCDRVAVVATADPRPQLLTPLSLLLIFCSLLLIVAVLLRSRLRSRPRTIATKTPSIRGDLPPSYEAAMTGDRPPPYHDDHLLA